MMNEWLREEDKTVDNNLFIDFFSAFIVICEAGIMVETIILCCQQPYEHIAPRKDFDS